MIGSHLCSKLMMDLMNLLHLYSNVMESFMCNGTCSYRFACALEGSPLARRSD